MPTGGKKVDKYASMLDRMHVPRSKIKKLNVPFLNEPLDAFQCAKAVLRKLINRDKEHQQHQKH